MSTQMKYSIYVYDFVMSTQMYDSTYVYDFAYTESFLASWGKTVNIPIVIISNHSSLLHRIILLVYRHISLGEWTMGLSFLALHVW